MAGVFVMNDEEAQEFGLQLWVKDDGNGGRFFHWWWQQLIADVGWLGVSEVIDIMNWMGRSTNTTINNLFGCNIAYVQLSKTWKEMGRMIVVAIKYL